MNNYEKILIGMPCMDMIPIKTVGCLLGMPGAKTLVANSLVYDARNSLVSQAINGGYEYLLFIDSDMIFNQDTLDKLLAMDKDIATGVYYARRGDHAPVCYPKLYPKSIFRKQEAVKFTVLPKAKIFKVEGCGMGFCLIKTSALRKIVKRYPNPFEPIKNLSEDLAFCYKARKCGFDIWARSDVLLKHIGSIEIDKDSWKNQYVVEPLKPLKK